MNSRETQLRNLNSEHVHKLFVILNSNKFWNKINELMPELGVHWGKIAENAGPDYGVIHIHILQVVLKLLGETQKHAKVFFADSELLALRSWRTTIGILLNMLWKTEMFTAFYFVTKLILGEEEGDRPAPLGTPAIIDITPWDQPVRKVQRQYTYSENETDDKDDSDDQHELNDIVVI